MHCLSSRPIRSDALWRDRYAYGLLAAHVSQNLAAVAAIAAAAAVYVILALALGAVTADDLRHFKKGEKWVQRLHLR